MFKTRDLVFKIAFCLILLLPSCNFLNRGRVDGNGSMVECEMKAHIYKFDTLASQCSGFKVEATIVQHDRTKIITGINMSGETTFNNTTGIDFVRPMEISIEIVEVNGDCPPLYDGMRLGPLIATMNWNDSRDGYTVEIDTDITMALKLGILFTKRTL